MNARTIARLARLVSLVLLGTAQMAAAPAADSPAAAVAAVVLGFHAALEAGDAQAASRLLAPDAVVLENGGKETRSEYVGHHLHEDIRFARAVPSQRGQVDVVVAGDVAWASSTRVTQGMFQSKAIDLVGAELMVLTRTASGWQIRAIHWSSRKGR